MSFNMLCGLCGPLEYGGWDERRDGLVDTLRRAHPDLLAAQELMVRANLDTVTGALPRLEAHYLDHGLPHFDSVVFFDRDRFELLERGAFWLSQTPDSPLGLGWGVSVPRSLAWVKLRDRRDGSEFYFAGTHLDNNRINKQPSLALIRRRLAAFGNAPVILAGDFNFNPGQSQFLELLTGATAEGPGFLDSYALARAHGTAAARERRDSDGSPATHGGRRIDYVYLSGGHSWRAADYTVDGQRYGWRHQFISDHRPVWVDLNWTPGATVAAARAPGARAGRE